MDTRLPRRTLELTAAERQQLEQVRDHDRRPYLRERAAALLKIAAGRSPHWVARQGLLKPRHPDTVYAWLNEYQATRTLRPRPACRRAFSPTRSGAGHRARPHSRPPGTARTAA